MDSLITAAARALAAGDPIGALKRVALRDDAPALALRGIAMAQLGDLARAKTLLRSAARAFGPREPVARARCVIAEAEIALVSRDLSWPAKALDSARATLEQHGDRVNAAHARYLEVRRLLLIGRLDEAEGMLAELDPATLPPALRTAHELAAFERAHELDLSFAPPLPYLMMTAVRAGDLKRAQHYADAYLRLGGELELRHFVRWYVARATGDSVALAAARAELPRATVASLRAISIVTIEAPVSVGDALQGVTERLARTVQSQERGELLRARHALALNAGRPSEARAALEELAAMRDEQFATAEVLPIFDAIYGDGDKSFAARAVARFSSVENPSSLVRCALGLWHASHGAFARAREHIRGLALDIAVDAVPVAGCGALVEAWIAIGEHRPEAQRLLNPIDSLTVVGLPLGDVRPYGGIALARLYVQLGAPDLALAAVRRRPFYRAWPAHLASYLRMEATLAEQLGDRAAAARAWRHYVTLREHPESVLAADAACRKAGRRSPIRYAVSVIAC